MDKIDKRTVVITALISITLTLIGYFTGVSYLTFKDTHGVSGHDYPISYFIYQLLYCAHSTFCFAYGFKLYKENCWNKGSTYTQFLEEAAKLSMFAVMLVYTIFQIMPLFLGIHAFSGMLLIKQWPRLIILILGFLLNLAILHVFYVIILLISKAYRGIISIFSRNANKA